MAAALPPFSLKKHGVTAPCHLLYKDKEIVCFEKGLIGPACFSELFKDYVEAMTRVGVKVDPMYGELSDRLRGKVGKYVVLTDAEFGEAFYCCYFPKMRKGEPEKYCWQLLSL